MVFQAIRSVLDQWHPPRDRVLWAPVLLGAGVAAYFALPVEPVRWLGATVLVQVTALWLVVRRKWPALSFVNVAIVLIVLGFTLAQGRTMLSAAPMLDRDSGVTRVEGRVEEITVSDSDSATAKRRVTLGDLKIEDMPEDLTPRTIRLSTRHMPPDLRPGERISVLAKLMPPSGPVAPDGFDYRRYAFFEGIGAVGFTLGKPDRLSPPDGGGDVWFNALRQTISKHLNTRMDHPESAVAAALLAGERSDIPDSINQDLIDAGLYHMLSISGLHVAIVCGVVFFTLRFLMALWPFLALHAPIKKIAALAALGGGIFYTLLAGAPVPTQRSMITTGIVLLAVMLDRAALSLRTLAIGALAVLVLTPESLVGASFQMSFAAVLSMVAFHESWGRKWMIEHRKNGVLSKIAGYFLGIAFTTVLVGLATLPVVLHHFGRLQLFGIVANAAAIPLMSFIVMPAGMAAMLLMPVGLDGPFLKVMEWGLRLTLRVAHDVAALPHAALALPSLPLGAYLAAVAGFLLFALWRGSFRWVGLPVMICAVAIGFMIPRPLVLIEAEGRAAGVGAAGQVAYITRKPTAYIRKNWLALWGGHEADNARALKTGALTLGDTRLSCDDLACRVETGQGGRLSILRDVNALFEECAWATLIIATDRAVSGKSCKRAQVITPAELYRAGGLAVYQQSGGAWKARPFTPEGRRPWSVAD